MTLETVAQFARLRSLLLWIEDPAWLVHPDGKVLVKNDAAADETPVPRWIVDYVAGNSTAMPICARVRRIHVDGHPRILAFGLPSRMSLRHVLEDLGLDEDVHVETAEHLVRGFSDEEISLLIGRSIDIVHTLVTQVHQLLRVTTRLEIIDLVRRARPSVVPPRNPAGDTDAPRRSIVPPQPNPARGREATLPGIAPVSNPVHDSEAPRPAANSLIPGPRPSMQFVLTSVNERRAKAR